MTLGSRRALAILAAVLTTVLVAGTTSLAPAQARDDRGSRWAPVAKAKIHPGVQMFTKGAQCTGNFVFRDNRGRVLVGYAAHCAGKGTATDTNGCNTRSRRLGTRVRFAQGATVATNGDTVGHGRLVYSSWKTMRRRGAGRNACAANDFALVRVSRGDERKVNPTVPIWGGPKGIAGGAPAGEQVYSYGQSSLRPTTVLSPKTGVSLGSTHGRWGWDVYTATPGIPGDSGSGFLDERGRALGTLSTIAIAPVAGSNGLGDLASELNYAQRFSGIPGLRLVRGTRPFTPVP